MKFIKIVIIIIFSILLSCNTYNSRRNCSEYSDFYCERLILNIRSKYMFSRVDEYFIWEKYGVEIVRDLKPTFTDSCYYDYMEEKIKEKNDIGILDSILTYIENATSDKVNKEIPLRFVDSTYTALLNSGRVDGKGAQVLDKLKFYNKIDSLGMVLPNIKTSISFWLTVDELGELDNVEIINFFCTGNSLDLDSIIRNSFKDVRWRPAFFQGEYVKYKYKETIIP